MLSPSPPPFRLAQTVRCRLHFSSLNVPSTVSSMRRYKLNENRYYFLICQKPTRTKSVVINIKTISGWTFKADDILFVCVAKCCKHSPSILSNRFNEPRNVKAICIYYSKRSKHGNQRI